MEEGNQGDGHPKGDFRSRVYDELHSLEETLEKLKPHLEDIKGRVESEAKRAKHSVEDQVQKNPWVAIGLVGLIFFVLGCLFSRSRD